MYSSPAFLCFPLSWHTIWKGKHVLFPNVFWRVLAHPAEFQEQPFWRKRADTPKSLSSPGFDPWNCTRSFLRFWYIIKVTTFFYGKDPTQTLLFHFYFFFHFFLSTATLFLAKMPRSLYFKLTTSPIFRRLRAHSVMLFWSLFDIFWLLLGFFVEDVFISCFMLLKQCKSHLFCFIKVQAAV